MMQKWLIVRLDLQFFQLLKLDCVKLIHRHTHHFQQVTYLHQLNY